MLTYSLVDRGTVIITGLDNQTGDKARFQGEYYSDKLPGFPLLGAVPYLISKLVLGTPSHPLGGKPAILLGGRLLGDALTSRLLTALTGALLVYWSRCLGCRAGRLPCWAWPTGWPRRRTSTPPSPTATKRRHLRFSHRSSCSGRTEHAGGRARSFFAGFLAAYAVVIELQSAPVSAILGLYLLFQCVRGERSG